MQFAPTMTPEQQNCLMDNAKLGKVSRDRIDHRRLLADEQITCAGKVAA